MKMKFHARIVARILLALGLMFLGVPAQSTRSAGTINVACGNTAGLIQAVVQAQNEATNPGQDTIILEPGCAIPYTFYVPYDETLNTYNALPGIVTSVRILGNGAVLERSYHPSTPHLRLFDIRFEGELLLDSVHIRNWSASFGAGFLNYGTAEITNSLIQGNHALNYGGAIANRDIMTLTNVTLTGNTAASSAGAIDNWLPNSLIYRGELTLINSTIARNTAASTGGIYNDTGGSVYLYNTILESNSNGNCFVRSMSNFTEMGGSVQWGDTTCGPEIRTVDPKLSPLNHNGGLTPTMAIGSGSAALEIGLPEACPDTDQRGFARPQPAGSRCDAGAFESNHSPYLTTQLSFDPPGVAVGQSSQLAFRLENLYHQTLTNSTATLKLSAGLTIAGPPEAQAGCSPTVVAEPGDDTIQVNFGNILPSWSCTFRVPVAAPSTGDYSANEIIVETGLSGVYTLAGEGRLRVHKGSAQISLISTRAQTRPGEAVQLKAVVQAEYPASAIPTGLVTIYQVSFPEMNLASQKPVNVEPLDEAGEAVFTLQPAQAGLDHYIAVYSGDPNYTTATSPVLDLPVSSFIINLPLIVGP